MSAKIILKSFSWSEFNNDPRSFTASEYVQMNRVIKGTAFVNAESLDSIFILDNRIHAQTGQGDKQIHTVKWLREKVESFLKCGFTLIAHWDPELGHDLSNKESFVLPQHIIRKRAQSTVRGSSVRALFNIAMRK